MITGISRGEIKSWKKREREEAVSKRERERDNFCINRKDEFLFCIDINRFCKSEIIFSVHISY
jgi:hypothetical protein